MTTMTPFPNHSSDKKPPFGSGFETEKVKN
jgi:hypothetical protein